MGWLLLLIGFGGIGVGCWRIVTWADFSKRRLRLLWWFLFLGFSVLLFHVGLGIALGLYPLLDW